MAYSIQDYVGEYTVRVGSLNQTGTQFEVGDKFYVGTGTHHDPPITGDKVGVSIYDSEGDRKFPAPEDEGYAYFYMESGNLVWVGYDDTHTLYQIQFTLVELAEQLKDQTTGAYRTIYGAVFLVDPDVIGVWGADDRIP